MQLKYGELLVNFDMTSTGMQDFWIAHLGAVQLTLSYSPRTKAWAGWASYSSGMLAYQREKGSSEVFQALMDVLVGLLRDLGQAFDALVDVPGIDLAKVGRPEE